MNEKNNIIVITLAILSQSLFQMIHYYKLIMCTRFMDGLIVMYAYTYISKGFIIYFNVPIMLSLFNILVCLKCLY